MSGPPYPIPPGAGSNGIGEYEIGVSPIGTIPSFDVWTTMISQYANSDIIDNLVLNFSNAIDQTQNFENFFNFIWNVDTAIGYGLDVWGRIVGVNRTLQIPSGKYFGFQEGGSDSYDPFGQSPFFNGQTLTQNYNLSDLEYRRLILAKAFANICNGSIPAINSMLLSLFPNRGNCYVQEGVPTVAWFGFAESTTASGFNQEAFYNGQQEDYMVIAYVFDFVLSPVDYAIVAQSGVLPKPTGVESSIVQTTAT